MSVSIKDAQSAARTLGLELHILNASAERDFDGVFAKLIQLRAAIDRVENGNDSSANPALIFSRDVTLPTNEKGKGPLCVALTAAPYATPRVIGDDQLDNCVLENLHQLTVTVLCHRSQN